MTDFMLMITVICGAALMFNLGLFMGRKGW